MSRITWIDRKEFEREYQDCFDAIYDPPLDRWPFRSMEWEVGLLPYGLNLLDSDYRALADAANDSGDDELMITEVESIKRHQFSAAIPWTRDKLEEVRTSSELGHLTTALFGLSGEWGAVAHSASDYCIVGGSDEFMDRFYVEAGGQKEVRDRFLSFAAKEWMIRNDDQQAVLSLVGWS